MRKPCARIARAFTLENNAVKVPNCWLWPDRNIGKRESRELRGQFNALVNDYVKMRAAVANLANVAEGIHRLVFEGRESDQDWARVLEVVAEAKKVLNT